MRYLVSTLLGALILVFSQAQAASLTTIFAADNLQNGNMFDVVALNEIVIRGFDINCDPEGEQDWEVYGKQGSYVGSDMTSADWVLLGSTSALACNATDTATPLPITVNVGLEAAQTYAFYITSTEQTGFALYTNGTLVGSVFSSDDNLQILEGAGKAYPFANTSEPRVWNGTVYYDLTAQAVPGLSGLGLGMLGLLLAGFARRRFK